jgi:predicted dehydrogenase
MVVTFVVIGAGNRGKVYARYALEHPELAQCVGVAEPRDYSRDLMVKNHKLAPTAVFQSWEQMAQKPKMADAAVICTQDQQHEAPAIAFAKLGYHILLEKPLSRALGCLELADLMGSYC